MIIEKEEYDRITSMVALPCVDAFIFRERKILLMKRNHHPAQGQWWVPGGRVQKGEPILEALRRKVQEETSLFISSAMEAGITETIFEDKHTINCSFFVEVLGDVLLNEDHSEYAWFDINNLSQLGLHSEIYRKVINIYDSFAKDQYVIPKERGQINIDTVPGNLIYEISKNKEVNTIVEIGTWNGLGSTMCVAKALSESEKEKNFISIELYKDKYEEALENLSEFSRFVNLMNGSIITESDLAWFDESAIREVLDAKEDINGLSYMHTLLWYQKDMENIRKSKNILSSMPDKIDFLILDGGEYTTYPEWQKLKDRTSIVFLDDTKIFKCAKIRKEIIESGQYETIYEDLSDRNGFSIFKKI